MSSWLGRPEFASLVSICVEEKYCFSRLIYISLNSERLQGLAHCTCLATSTFLELEMIFLLYSIFVLPDMVYLIRYITRTLLLLSSLLLSQIWFRQ